ncbi:hypothetical protein CI610_00840 [invertebrate metagenome]|uniref:Uncharacterized protein n=1 Tax=invertebrate metagenome TaxID=1711999 RepID=A0A2H9TAP5_9ZZZZ
MIALASALQSVLKKAKTMQSGDGVTLLTFKQDRGFSVDCLESDQFQISEFGYERDETIYTLHDLKKALKSVISREFPRSNKVYLRSHGKR